MTVEGDAMATRHIIGGMTGTSIDALDAAMVRIEGTGLAMCATFVRGLTRPLGDLGPRLRSVAEQQPTTAREIATLMREFAMLHADAANDLMSASGVKADLIAVHGQTVFHKPPVSWQMFTPPPLSPPTAFPVVFDLRAADLAHGGQGAPITPLADLILFGNATERRAVLNLGGFCNITLLPASRDLAGIRGFDVCACNHLLDGVARTVLGSAFDNDGAAAMRGKVESEALDDLIGALESLAGAKRSLGTGDELSEWWVKRYASRMIGQDLAATACEGIGRVIARRVHDEGSVDRVLLAGGGARNKRLANAIAEHACVNTCTTSDNGVPIEMREAVCMAVLGALCQDRVPITLPHVTGVPEPAPVAGVWAYPG